MNRATVLLIIVFILFGVSISNALNIVYVDVNSPNDPGTGSYEDPFRRIQDAIDDANDGDVVEIQPGLYTGGGNYDLDPNGKSITIRSTNPEDPNIVASTIIDPNSAGRGFYFHSNENSNCMVSGLTIRNGYTLLSGGGVLCKDSSPTINNCIITGNSAVLYGGGIFCDNSSPEIKGSMINNNSAQDGGGIGCWWYANPKFTNCIISNNEASDSSGGGGGLDCVAYNNINLTNCTLTRNLTTGSGGAVRCEESEVTIKNCILWANNAPDGAQIALAFFVSNPSTISIDYSDVQDGNTGVYTDPCTILVWGSGNIDMDPCFVSFEANGDPNMWDFHLQSAYGRWDPNSQSWVTDSNTSVCIDGGDPNSDWGDEPWPNGKRINMGTYGRTARASKNGNIADFDISGAVNFVDLAEFSSQWLLERLSADVFIEASGSSVNFLDWAVFVAAWQSTPSSWNWNIRCDIFPENGDEVVNLGDLAAFMDQWLQLGVYCADIAPSESDGIVNMLDLAIFAENWLW